MKHILGNKINKSCTSSNIIAWPEHMLLSMLAMQSHSASQVRSLLLPMTPKRIHDARMAALSKPHCSVDTRGQCPDRAVRVDRYQGRFADIRCDLHRGLLCGTKLPFDLGEPMAAKVNFRTLPFTWCCSAFRLPIWLCREGNNFFPKPIPMRFIAFKNDYLNI